MADANDILAGWLNSAGLDGHRNSMVAAQGTGSKTNFDFNFAGGYIDASHIKAYIYDSVTSVTSEFTPTLVGPSTVQVVPAPTPTQTLVIYRDSPKGSPLVNFTTGAPLTEVNLDLIARQAVFGVAELIDRFDSTRLSSETASEIAGTALSRADNALTRTAAAEQAAANAAQSAANADSRAAAAETKAQAALDHVTTGASTSGNNEWTGENVFRGTSHFYGNASIGNPPTQASHAVRKADLDAKDAAARADLVNYADFTANERANAHALNAVQTAAPPGMVAFFAQSWPSPGWLKCNGAAVSRTAYAALFAQLGTHYGAGDGATTFNLPDMRGMFARGFDDGRGLDPARGFGAHQGPANMWHNHSFYDPGHAHVVNDPSHSHTAWTVGGGSHTHAVTGRANENTDNGGLAGGGGAATATEYTSTAPDHTHAVGVGWAYTGVSVQASSTGGQVGYSGGDESRPHNVALLACIKY